VTLYKTTIKENPSANLCYDLKKHFAW